MEIKFKLHSIWNERDVFTSSQIIKSLREAQEILHLYLGWHLILSQLSSDQACAGNCSGASVKWGSGMVTMLSGNCVSSKPNKQTRHLCCSSLPQGQALNKDLCPVTSAAGARRTEQGSHLHPSHAMEQCFGDFSVKGSHGRAVTLWVCFHG